MKRTLIALALALGATAAVAEPTLDLQSARNRRPSGATRRKRPPTRPASQLVDDNAADYPFNP